MRVPEMLNNGDGHLVDGFHLDKMAVRYDTKTFGADACGDNGAFGGKRFEYFQPRSTANPQRDEHHARATEKRPDVRHVAVNLHVFALLDAIGQHLRRIAADKDQLGGRNLPRNLREDAVEQQRNRVEIWPPVKTAEEEELIWIARGSVRRKVGNINAVVDDSDIRGVEAIFHQLCITIANGNDAA